MERPNVGVGVVVLKDGKVLMGRRKNSHGSGFWAFAGGHLEYKETVEECAKRELFEETGLVATVIRRGPWTNDIIDETKHYLTIFIFVEEFTGDLSCKEPDKCEGWHWMSWDDMPEPLFPAIQSLKKLFHPNSENVFQNEQA